MTRRERSINLINRIAMYLWDSPSDFSSDNDLHHAGEFLEEVIEKLRFDCIIASKSYFFPCEYTEWALAVLTKMQGDMKYIESVLALLQTELLNIAALAEKGVVSPELVLTANALAEHRKRLVGQFSQVTMSLASKLYALAKSANNLAD